MAKYYVSSGNLKVIISRKDIKTAMQAATEACLSHYNDKTRAEPYIYVSEQGFTQRSTDSMFDTLAVMKKAGFFKS